MSFRGLNASMEMSALLVNAGRLAAPDYAMQCIEVRAVRRPYYCCILLITYARLKKTAKMKKAPRETQTLRTGCSKVEPKIFAPPQTAFLGSRDGQN